MHVSEHSGTSNDTDLCVLLATGEAAGVSGAVLRNRLIPSTPMVLDMRDADEAVFWTEPLLLLGAFVNGLGTGARLASVV